MQLPSVPFDASRYALEAARALGAASAAGLLLAGCVAPLPRDLNGSPPTARLVPNAIPPAPITPDEKLKLDALNQQILRDQDAAIARDEQARAYAQTARYGYPSMSLYYGGWGGGGWGGGIGYSTPGYWRGWGGYPYWW